MVEKIAALAFILERISCVILFFCLFAFQIIWLHWYLSKKVYFSTAEKLVQHRAQDR